MHISKAVQIRRRLVALITKRQIYPRTNTWQDSVCLALFARMVELHRSVCTLARRGMRRDAAILGRTICEVAIWVYWLTNSENEDRFERYVQFGGKVYSEFNHRFDKYLAYKHVPVNPIEIDLIANSKKLFKDRDLQWNDRNIWQMANEPDIRDNRLGGVANLAPQSGIFYFWFSLHSHPTIWAIQSFLPQWIEEFTRARASHAFKDIPEICIIFLSTTWLFFITWRINAALHLRREKELDRIFKAIK